MKELLTLGANVSHYDQSMMLCSLNQDLYDACKRGYVTRMKQLLTLGANESSVNHVVLNFIKRKR